MAVTRDGTIHLAWSYLAFECLESIPTDSIPVDSIRSDCHNVLYAKKSGGAWLAPQTAPVSGVSGIAASDVAEIFLAHSVSFVRSNNICKQHLEVYAIRGTPGNWTEPIQVSQTEDRGVGFTNYLATTGDGKVILGWSRPKRDCTVEPSVLTDYAAYSVFDGGEWSQEVRVSVPGFEFTSLTGLTVSLTDEPLLLLMAGNNVIVNPECLPSNPRCGRVAAPEYMAGYLARVHNGVPEFSKLPNSPDHPEAPIPHSAAVDSKGRVHVVSLEGDEGNDDPNDIYYVVWSEGKWSTHEKIRTGHVRPDVAKLGIGPDDTIHLAWHIRADRMWDIFYATKAPGGDWSKPERVTYEGKQGGTNPGFRMAVDAAGNVHLVYMAAAMCCPENVYYTMKPAAASPR